MLHLRKPSARQIGELLAARAAFSYGNVGATDGDGPALYAKFRLRRSIGRGPAVYERASEALRSLEVFRLGWAEVISCGPIEEGTYVCSLSRQFGFWALNHSRVVYCINETGSSDRFGFAVGTLSSHLVRGEERFLVERDFDDRVHFDVFSFSRPAHWLARIGYPFARMAQKRFVRGVARTMERLADPDPG
ncbi:MAG: DUF1990 family protein [Planctomycetota bacterium]|jgi:uncharacterized protein (UPF0548 family)